MFGKKKKEVQPFDPKVNNGSKKPIQDRIVRFEAQDKFSNYPSNGLTPQRLAAIFREADAGNVERQMELFEEMEEKDTHLFSQLQTRKDAVTGIDWEIIPFEPDNEQDKMIADFVSDQLKGLDNFDEVLVDILDAIGKGISFSEICWAFENGFYTIEDIKWIHPKKVFWDIITDEIKIRTKDFPAGIELPEHKFIIHKYKARTGHPSRAGILRVVAWMYLFKNYDIKDWVSFCEVFGIPLRLGTYGAGSSEEDKQALATALIQIGTDAAGIIPDGAAIDIKEANKTSSIDLYERLARYCDEQMSKAVLGQTLTSDSGGGSFAQSKTHNEVRHDLTAADCKALAATIKRDLIKPLVYFNFGENKRLPIMKFDCEVEGDKKEKVEICKTLICDIGLNVPTSYLYKEFRIPKPDADEEIAKPVAASTQLASDQPKEYKVNVLKEEKEDSENDSQDQVDGVIKIATKHSGEIFSELFQPVLNLIKEAESLEEIRETLDDEDKVTKIYREMDTKKLDELLEKGMYIADLLGRSME